MNRPFVVGGATMIVACGAAPPPTTSPAGGDVTPGVVAIVARRCAPCHMPGGEAAGDHDFSSPTTLMAQRSLIGARVEAHVMPPPEAPRPTDDESG